MLASYSTEHELIWLVGIYSVDLATKEEDLNIKIK